MAAQGAAAAAAAGTAPGAADGAAAALAAALGAPAADATRMLARCPQLARKSGPSLAAKLEYVVTRSGVGRPELLALLADAPELLLRSPAAIAARLEALARLMGVGAPEAAAAAGGGALALTTDASLGRVSTPVLRELRNMYADEGVAAGVAAGSVEALGRGGGGGGGG